MNKTDSTFKKNEILLLSILGVFALLLIAVTVVPDLRASVKKIFSDSNRVVLTKVKGKISASGPEVTVLKIKMEHSLSVEVYTEDADGNLLLMTKIPLADSRDGHFFLKGNATDLALTDIDADSSLEIVAPTYDDQMVPRLNIFKFNANSNSFDRVSAPPSFNPK